MNIKSDRKLKQISLGLLLTLNAAITSANPIACQAVICLSNLPGVIPMECQSARKTYFSIQVWSPYYNAPATASARDAFLRTCPFVASPSSVEPNLIAIRTKYGMIQNDPGN